MTPASSWKCEYCGRQVPARIATCYCGRERPAAPARHAGPAPSAAPRRRVSVLRVAVITLAAAALAGAVSYYGGRALSTPAPPLPGARARDLSIPAIRPPTNDPDAAAPPSDATVQRALRGVVLIETPTSHGTGFFAGPDLITTTRHVIGQASSASVTTQDGGHLQATVVRTASRHDLALLRVPAEPPFDRGLPPASSRDVRNGQAVFRLSWPRAVAHGFVRSLRRDGPVELLESTLTTSAADDGAPILDRLGRVIAVVTTTHEGSRSSGFAVTMDGARQYFRP